MLRPMLGLGLGIIKTMRVVLSNNAFIVKDDESATGSSQFVVKDGIYNIK